MYNLTFGTWLLYPQFHTLDKVKRDRMLLRHLRSISVHWYTKEDIIKVVTMVVVVEKHQVDMSNRDI